MSNKYELPLSIASFKISTLLFVLTEYIIRVVILTQITTVFYIILQKVIFSTLRPQFYTTFVEIFV